MLGTKLRLLFLKAINMIKWQETVYASSVIVRDLLIGILIGFEIHTQLKQSRKSNNV